MPRKAVAYIQEDKPDVVRTAMSGHCVNEKAVLAALGASGSWVILNFNQISERAGLDRNQVRAACRSLKKAGLASYETGGSVGGGYNGAGYMITASGKNTFGEGKVTDRQNARRSE